MVLHLDHLGAFGQALWAGRTVVVAGATGFLGGWLVRRLLERQATVVALVRRRDRRSQVVHERLLERTHVEEGDLGDPAFLARVFDTHRTDAFFHAAAGGDVNSVLRDPLECFHAGVTSTWTVLDILRRTQPSCVAVISSSDKAYGAQALPFRETNALTPVHPYEVAKASQDLVAQSFGKVYGMPVGVTRCGNYFGPYDFNFSRLVPGVCQAIARGEVPRLRSDGQFSRDYLYIEDAVDVQLMLAERLLHDESIRGQAFNFSYGSQLTVLDIVRQVLALAGVKSSPIVENTVQSEIRHMQLSSEKARQVLGWEPTVGFERGLARTVDWYLGFFLANGALPDECHAAV